MWPYWRTWVRAWWISHPVGLVVVDGRPCAQAQFVTARESFDVFLMVALGTVPEVSPAVERYPVGHGTRGHKRSGGHARRKR